MIRIWVIILSQTAIALSLLLLVVLLTAIKAKSKQDEIQSLLSEKYLSLYVKVNVTI